MILALFVELPNFGAAKSKKVAFFVMSRDKIQQKAKKNAKNLLVFL